LGLDGSARTECKLASLDPPLQPRLFGHFASLSTRSHMDLSGRPQQVVVARPFDLGLALPRHVLGHEYIVERHDSLQSLIAF
jgi:hypothetical protein